MTAKFTKADISKGDTIVYLSRGTRKEAVVHSISMFPPSVYVPHSEGKIEEIMVSRIIELRKRP